MSAEGAEARLETLLARLEAVRLRLEQAQGDPDLTLELLGEVSELSKEAAAEVERAREAARDAE